MADFFYASEKFAAARRILMLPHPKGEATAVADAFHECSLGLHQLDRSKLDQNSLDWVNQLESLMDTKHVQGETGRWLAKAETFSIDEKLEISRLVDELAWWFSEKTR